METNYTRLAYRGARCVARQRGTLTRHGEHDIGGIIAEFEGLGLVYFDDVFELTGTWPGWTSSVSTPGVDGPGRMKPSQPHS